jgi:hypothetical protein
LHMLSFSVIESLTTSLLIEVLRWCCDWSLVSQVSLQNDNCALAFAITVLNGHPFLSATLHKLQVNLRTTSPMQLPWELPRHGLTGSLSELPWHCHCNMYVDEFIFYKTQNY